MPKARDTSMLRLDSKKLLIAMAEKGMEAADLAQATGISKNIIYTMRRGFYSKLKNVGAVARVLEVKVADLVEDGSNVLETKVSDLIEGDSNVIPAGTIGQHTSRNETE